MLEEKDVETFIKAKRDQLAIDLLLVLAVASLAALVVLEALAISHDYTLVLATASTVLVGAATGQSRWVSVSRSQLVQTLERIINRDSEALEILARKKQKGGGHGRT